MTVLKMSRYEPWLGRDGSVLVSADRVRQLDMEKLVERLSQDFISKIYLMSDAELVLLEILAEGIAYKDEDETARRTKAAVTLRFRRQRKAPPAPATEKRP